jgi:Kef-type K+ transport system membrane component KefB
MLIVFGSAKLMAELFERLHQPGIVGEIIAGVLIGPSVLGWIALHDTLKALADLGVMFLLFNAGLQVKASEMLRVGGTATLVAALGVVTTFLGGWGILLAWGSPRMEAVFVAAALVATSVGITASALAARGLLQEVASRIILAAAVIDDVMGLIVVAVVSSMARGPINVPDIALTAGLAAAFTLVVAKWGAGLALSDTANTRVRDLTRGVSELLVPFFLVGIGLRLDLALFRSKSTLVLALLILAMVIVTKLLGCGLGAFSAGWENALKVGLGMVPRGEVTMVVAQMGLSLAVIRPEIYAVVVFTTVASALLTPLLLRIGFRSPTPQKART